MHLYRDDSVSIDEYLEIREKNDEKMYEQHDMKTDTGKIVSKFLSGFRVDLEAIFGDR